MTSKMISLNNGATYETANDAMAEINERGIWDEIVNLMDDDTLEQVAYELAPCTNLEFLARYLELAPADLIVG